MPILTVIIVLIVVGVLLWLVNTFIPMAGAIKSLLNIVVLILLIVWLLNVFGLLNPIVNALKEFNINAQTHKISLPASTSNQSNNNVDH